MDAVSVLTSIIIVAFLALLILLVIWAVRQLFR